VPTYNTRFIILASYKATKDNFYES